MDHGAAEVLPTEPSEEHFCLSLRNGLILCNVLNKVNPGAIPKVLFFCLNSFYVYTDLSADKHTVWMKKVCMLSKQFEIA